MKKLFSIAAVCGAMLIAAAVGASAAKASTITADWTGTLTGTPQDPPYDTNHFGGISAGQTVTVHSVFDSNTGIGTAALTINGHEFDFPQPSSLVLSVWNALTLDMGDVAGTFLHMGFYDPSLTSLTAPFDGDCTSGSCYGTFVISTGGSSSGNFDLTHLTVAVSNTPIPAALPLFASALMGLGFVGWRRKAKASI